MTYLVFKSSDLEVFCEKCMIKSLKNSQETPLQGPLFKKKSWPTAFNVIKQEVLALVLFCELSEVSTGFY